MQKIKRVLWGLVLGLTAWWLWVDPLLTASPAFFAVRNSLVNYTGILGMGMMSVGMVLAVRPVWFGLLCGALVSFQRAQMAVWIGVGPAACRWSPAAGGANRRSLQAVSKLARPRRGGGRMGVLRHGVDDCPGTVQALSLQMVFQDPPGFGSDVFGAGLSRGSADELRLLEPGACALHGRVDVCGGRGRRHRAVSQGRRASHRGRGG